jgi:hypothetical protein
MKWHLFIIALIILCTIIIIHSHRKHWHRREHCGNMELLCTVSDGQKHHSHVWKDGAGTVYANKCHGTDHGSDGCTSGTVENFTMQDLKKYAKAHMGTFSNTLQRRMGMGSAGSSSEKYSSSPCVGTFDCRGEHFTATNDVAAHTMYGGYYGRSVLPG